MAQVLIVPIGELASARQTLRRALTRANAHICGFDFDSDEIVPRSDVGRIYGARLCLVGLHPNVQKQILAQFQLEPANVEVLGGTVKQNNGRIQAWLEREIAPRDPTYAEIATEIASDYRNLVVASNALLQADRVSSAVGDSAGGFPAFLEQVLRALGELSSNERLVGEQLDDFFAREAPLAAYASSGGESLRYADPLRGGTICNSKKHLKPKSERRGNHDRAIKPRLYFDVTTQRDESTTPPRVVAVYVLLLYFGPHPPSGTTLEAGNLVIPKPRPVDTD